MRRAGATFGLYFKQMSQREANTLRRHLNELAAQHGYLASRGPTAGEGNAADLLRAIASGEVATVLLADEERGMLIDWLHQQADQLSTSNPLLAGSLTNLAQQLFRAALREQRADEEEIRSK
jgi:hypothetical protein